MWVFGLCLCLVFVVVSVKGHSRTLFHSVLCSQGQYAGQVFPDCRAVVHKSGLVVLKLGWHLPVLSFVLVVTHLGSHHCTRNGFSDSVLCISIFHHRVVRALYRCTTI